MGFIPRKFKTAITLSKNTIFPSEFPREELKSPWLTWKGQESRL